MDKSSGRRTLAVADAKLIAIAIADAKLIAIATAKPITNTNPAASLYLPARPHPFRGA